MPRRWSMAPPPRGKWVRQVTATAHGEPITAPLSGRPCLGYEVALRWDDHGGAPLATWALVEQRVNLDPATTLQEGAAVHLALPRERLDLTSASASAEVVRYLQTRGLDFTDGSLTIYESIIEPGMRIELTERTGGFIVKPAC